MNLPNIKLPQRLNKTKQSHYLSPLFIREKFQLSHEIAEQLSLNFVTIEAACPSAGYLARSFLRETVLTLALKAVFLKRGFAHFREEYSLYFHSHTSLSH